MVYTIPPIKMVMTGDGANGIVLPTLTAINHQLMTINDLLSSISIY